MRKRSVESETVPSTTPSPSLSENVNLFQSLRVLQEGENDEDRNASDNLPSKGNENTSTLLKLIDLFPDYSQTSDVNSVCLKTGWFSALLALGGGAMCLLGGALLATCSRLRRSAIDRALSSTMPAAFNGYMAHKGRIN